MADKILNMFFDFDRWVKAIDKGVFKDIRKSELIRLTDENTRIAMAGSMIKGEYNIFPPHTAQIPKENGEFKETMEDELGTPIHNKSGVPHATFMCWFCYEELGFQIARNLFNDQF